VALHADADIRHLEACCADLAKVLYDSTVICGRAGSNWNANAETPRISALVLCYSVAEYCAPVWSLSFHSGLVDVQLNNTMRLITSSMRFILFS